MSWHGVTTVLMGNCGVTFAPCKPSDQELLAGMMETVEDIPKNAILTGLVHDFPDGAPRYIQRSKGYNTTIVNGEVNVVDGEHTGARAGQILRHGA